MVNIYEPQLTILQQGILRYLFIKAGMTFNARGLARPLNRTQAGIIKALPKLEKEGLVKIKKDKDSGRWSIELNRDNSKVIAMKRVENLKMFYESGLAGVLEEKFPGSTIILFGSYSRGEDSMESDIDIAVIGVKEKDINLTKFENLLEKNIIINFYPSFNKIHKHLRDSILNGILLSGSVDI
ncbi:nucleotidyltransferase domain protein [archaeon BMS3Abin17]|nr:nucleotidyltransferase domain protein [archaeon BMS3Abin17]HDZ60836.1 hypothetical protein [Candidatus Pacearchaeota archaeon]